MSPLYRNSPYFSLDIDIKCITDNITDNDNVQEEYYNGDVETERDDRQEECHTEKNVPRISCNEKVRKNFGLSCANTCRELLNEIKGLAYLVEDQQGTLNELQETLFQAKKKLANIAKKENGFMLEKKSDQKKSLKIKIKSYALPLRKRKKAWAGRIGEKKEKLEIASHIKVETENEKVKNNNIIEMEYPLEDFLDGNEKPVMEFAVNSVISISDDDGDDAVFFSVISRSTH